MRKKNVLNESLEAFGFVTLLRQQAAVDGASESNFLREACSKLTLSSKVVSKTKIMISCVVFGSSKMQQL